MSKHGQQEDEKRPDYSTYRRLLRYVRPYSFRLGLGIFFGLIFGSSNLGLLGALRKNLDVMFDPGELPLWTLVAVAALLPVFAIVRSIGDFASRYFVEWVGNRVVMDLRSRTFAHIHDLSLLYFTQSRTGDLITRVTSDTMMIQRAVSGVIGDMAREPFALLAAVGYLLWLDARLAALSLVLFPICIIPVALFGRRVRKSARQSQERFSDVISILQESIIGVRIVKAFGMEQYEKDRFDVQNQKMFRRLMRVVRARASVEPIIITISFIGLSLVLLYARWTHMSTGDLFTFAAALVMMYQPAKKLSRIQMQIQQSCASADRIFEILDTPVSVAERPDARRFDEPVREIAFRDVTFAYEEQTILDGISFTVKAGECVAFVGSSGAGKTTLVSLLPRFFDVNGGAVCLNEYDIRDLTLASLRGQIGMVTQETVLFNDTVANNIAYGKKEVSREAIEEAARKAHAHEFIVELSDGYQTVIGEQGLRLSGGQRQRLAIARAMLRNPPILILDEATSSLDTESERQVQIALDDLMTNRTVLAIAHRLSTIQQADRIIVLAHGKIAEQGTHEELLARGGQYKYLYDLQFKDRENRD